MTATRSLLLDFADTEVFGSRPVVMPLDQEIWSLSVTIHERRRRPRAPMPRRKRIAAAAALLFFTLAAVLFGHGAWIYGKAKLAQVLLRSAWSRTLAGQENVRPWPGADLTPVAKLRIRNRDLIVLSGVSGRSLAFGPGHLGGSAMPGEIGNCVISAHRDTDFAVLRDLAPGDEIEVQAVEGSVFRYRVRATRVVNETDTWIAADRPVPTLTLLTCWPFDAIRAGGELRWAVTAELEPAR